MKITEIRSHVCKLNVPLCLMKQFNCKKKKKISMLTFIELQ